MLKCDNCNNRYDREEQLRHVFPDIPDLLARLDPGGHTRQPKPASS